MSAHAGTAPRTSASLETRLRATARSEWIKFRSVRSGPAVLLATAVILLVTAWLLCAYYRNSWATMSPASKASFDPVFISLRGIEGAIDAVAVDLPCPDVRHKCMPVVIGAVLVRAEVNDSRR